MDFMMLFLCHTKLRNPSYAEYGISNEDVWISKVSVRTGGTLKGFALNFF